MFAGYLLQKRGRVDQACRGLYHTRRFTYTVCTCRYRVCRGYCLCSRPQKFGHVCPSRARSRPGLAWVHPMYLLTSADAPFEYHSCIIMAHGLLTSTKMNYLISPKTSLFFSFYGGGWSFIFINIHYFCLLLCLQRRVFSFVLFLFLHVIPIGGASKCAGYRRWIPSQVPIVSARDEVASNLPVSFCVRGTGVGAGGGAGPEGGGAGVLSFYHYSLF